MLKQLLLAIIGCFILGFGLKNSILVGAIILALAYLAVNSRYKTTSYYKVTHNSYFSTRLDKGKYGEYLVYKKLKSFEEQGAKFLFNLYIPKEDGSTTEIDLIMISSKGIFVFESKNYSGWIFGDETSPFWYQTLPRGKKSQKEKFYNPILQNKNHIKHLHTLLKEENICVSVVVFSERCTLKNISVDKENVSIVKREKLIQLITKLSSDSTIDLERNKTDDIYNKLYPYTQTSVVTKVEHVEAINQNNKKQVLNNEKPVTNNTDVQKPVVMKNDSSVCPRCGGKLVLRTAQNGSYAGRQFYGCSNYPKCRYIKNIDK